ncbi:MAG: hypothetical protein LIR46_00945 [Bacteroidota bacterium]|nr:hypothetical protein [Bacteroidota bacterium]
MTRKYIYVRTPHQMDRDTVVYFLSIGDGIRGKKILSSLRTIASFQQAWFELWDEVSLFRLIHAEEETFGKLHNVTWQFRTVKMEGSEFLKLLQQHHIELYEMQLTEPRAKVHLLSKLSTDFYMLIHRQKSSPSVPTSTRKYLSLRRGTEVRDALIGAIMIPAIMFFIYLGSLIQSCRI